MPASAFLLAFAAAWIHGVSNVFVGRRQGAGGGAVLVAAGIALVALTS